ncbi:glycosyltransferase [Ruficoccus amylovorans]|uniref:Glycosyltransferase n=1 Tax=Ruficoccus amylovorans TaxID=1804625 RepID=A0A842HGG0_9BACT|nr:glycosyltransferase [Ruficoccus amylovorans]MBC2595613.1 glycosyltransferase [Ruficoccus amylovorans]
MKIAFITHGNFKKHATLKRATGMAEPLIDAGHEVAIFMEDCPDNQEKVTLECPRAKMFWHQRQKAGWKEQRAKQKALSQWQPDVVWICGVGLRNWVFRPTKTCIILGDHSELYSVISTGRLRRLFYWGLEWLYSLYFDGHICASRYLETFYAKRLKRFGKRNTVHYSPYANNDAVIFPPKAEDNALHERFGDKKIILYMGSFMQGYGFWDMPTAFKRLAQTRDDFVAVMIGRGAEKQAAIDWVRQEQLGSVIHIEGYIAEEDLPSYFSIAHAFLCPLRDIIQDWARCPSKLFMYLPFRRPVVTCAIGEAAELFGESGCYYNPNDTGSLAETLARVLDDPCQFSTPNPEDHTYTSRTKDFLQWIESCFQKKSRK